MSPERTSKSYDELLESIAVKAQVKEGKEFVRVALREIFKHGTIGSKSLARKIFLPIPTVAALRKELENEGLISRVKKGALLTEKGVKFVTKELGLIIYDDFICDLCDGSTLKLPDNADLILDKLRKYMSQRPTPLTNIDQAFGKPITALRRALLMVQNGDIENRNILLLGDDDFTSLAISLLVKNAKITVIDIDQRLLDIIQKISVDDNYRIKCIQMDLRNEIPDDIRDSFDTILTDPPYTKIALKLFLSRAVQAIRKEKNKKIYLAFAHREPNEVKLIQEIILEHGLIIQQILPGFNLYEGAELIGNTSQLMVLTTTDRPIVTIKEIDKESALYTGEINPTKRIYICENGHEINVGISEKFKTIELLKENGCPICKSKTSFHRKKTIKN
ncbi:MAG: putative methyltransferase [Asgard group archaeon]|nr:putative methyltransferase [Asgard group archaeon]